MKRGVVEDGEYMHAKVPGEHLKQMKKLSLLEVYEGNLSSVIRHAVRDFLKSKALKDT